MTFQLPEAREPVTGHDELTTAINDMVISQVPKRRRLDALPLFFGIGQAPKGVGGITWLWHMADVVDGSLAETDSGLAVNRELTSAASLTQLREGENGLRIAPNTFLRLVIDSAQSPATGISS